MSASGEPSNLQLRRRLRLVEELPGDPLWAAEPPFLERIAEHALQHRPATLLECGCGRTTLILAACCRANDRGHLYSLEHDSDHAAATRAALAREELAEWVTLIAAPLREWSVERERFLWYDTAELGAEGVEMVVIDGPPGPLQRLSRYPALPQLLPRLAPGATLFLDDAARPDERAIVARWQAEVAGLEAEAITTPRGCSRLRLPPGRRA